MIRAFEYLTNLAVRYPLPNPLPRERDKVAENQRAVELGIRWQVNLKMFRLDSPIPSPRGRRLGRGQASRRLASLAKDTTLSTQ